MEQFSLTFPDPGLYVLCGPTASGKSLICRLIAGRVRPTSGEVRIDGSRPRSFPGGRPGDFYSEADGTLTFNESIRDFLSAELSAAGVSPRSAAEYFGLVDSYFAGGVNAPMATLSRGEGMILQAVLAAAAPGRIAILDGHLNSLSEAAALYAWHMLQSSLVEHEKFIIVTANGTHDYLDSESARIRLAGGLPVTIGE